MNHDYRTACRTNLKHTILAAACVCAASMSASAQPAPGIYRVPGAFFYGVNMDGSVVVGRNSAYAPIRWTPTGGVQALPLPPGFRRAVATAVSWDGRVIGGQSYPGTGQLMLAWRNGAVELVGDLPGDPDSAECSAVSPNGSTLVGVGRVNGSPPARAVRWTPESGLVPLGDFRGENTYAAACSYDAGVVVGFSSTSFTTWRWDQFTGFTSIAIPLVRPIVLACSADASVLVGQGTDVSGPNPVVGWVWDSATSSATIVRVPGATSTYAPSVSADGRVVVGRYADSTNTTPAFIWDRHFGARDLRQVALEQLGSDVGALGPATGLSADGRTIVGGEYVLRLRAPCAGDVDDGTGGGGRDGNVTIDDLNAFLQWMAYGDYRADLDDGSGRGTPDAAITLDDLLYFLAGYEGGC